MTDLMEETLKDLQLKNITIIHGPLEKKMRGPGYILLTRMKISLNICNGI
jgi:hypothetical protein